LGCRLNWRRPGRLERPKECRGIKREQKGPPPSLSPSLPRDLLSPSLSSFALAGARARNAGPHTRVLSAVLVRHSLLFSVCLSFSSSLFLLRLLHLDESPDFSSHVAHPRRPLSGHRRRIPAVTLSLSRSHGRREGTRDDRRKHFRNATCANPPSIIRYFGMFYCF